MKGSLCAGIRMLDTPYHVDVIYDYLVPPELADSVRVGRFVTAPFGMHNQLRLGLVTELRDHSEYKDLKSIHGLCPESLALGEEMLGLVSFLRSRTLCSVGDAVRAVVPTAALTRLNELYEVDPSIDINSDEIRSSDLFVYRYLQEHGERSLKHLREKLDIRAESAVRRLAKLGALRRRVVLEETGEGKQETCWTLSVSPDAARELMEGRAWDGVKLTSANHRNILAVLLGEEAPIAQAELIAQADVTAAQIKAMEKKGLIAGEIRRVGRNPYTEAPYLGQTPQTLNEEQTAALQTLERLAFSGEAKAALLHGVTGSGKTRVMTALIDRLLEEGRGVIMLLPEIALTPQSVSIFCSRYGNRVAVIHSALSTGERYDAYCRIKRGEADVVIGTRSAVFAPVENLGAIIIDEEQEHTYKSDQNPKYHTKDVARFRCAHHKALMLLASATPSLESYKKAVEGVYTLVELRHRYSGADLPRVTVVDMRAEVKNGNTSELSEDLLTSVRDTLARGEQCILFLNRRGYNRTVTCRSCGKPLTCPNCSVAMTYHTARWSYREGQMVCHWCGMKLPVPKECPECHSEHLGHTGYGTQRIEEELGELFPTARILRMDADTTTSKTAYDRMLGKFRRGEADILLGTQMVTKGHDFPNVTLVGVLLADASLYLDDYRASERTFAMLTQVIGRAGRGDRVGRAIIQTNNPDSEVISLASAQDYPTFYQREARLRKLLCFPPACDIALLTVSCPLETELMQGTRRLAQELESLRQEEAYREVELVVFGPFEAPVYRVDNRYRMRMVIKCRLTRTTLEMFGDLMCRFQNGCGNRIRLSVDFNPSNL